MISGHVLFNPFAGGGNCVEDLSKLETLMDAKLEFHDITKVEDYKAIFAQMDADAFLVIAGGDGTLNRFVNATEGIQIPNEILYYPCGSGNDFAREIAPGCEGKPVSITKYLKGLPQVEVKGKKYRFINGIGFGIDGYCCQVGDEQRAAGKKVDYTAIAIKGLLFHYKPCNVKITVDGKTECFKNAWMAPTMHGRYYGGGMIPTPGQDRNAEDRQLSVMIFHGSGSLHTLMMFPSIFKGEHIKYSKHVRMISGKQITVEFDSPRPLQIDGETIRDVTSYTATACPVAEEVKC